MLDLDQRIIDGLHVLADRAPAGAEVWPAAERYVATHRKRRHAIAGGIGVVALVGGGVATAVVVRSAPTKAVVSSPGPGPDGPSGGVLGPTGPIEGSFTIHAAPSDRLVFQPSSVNVSTGIYAIALAGGSDTSHTLDFDDPATLWSPLAVNTYGEVVTARAFFGHAGDYTFYCAVPGHRAAGMEGVVHVTGPTVTLAQAEADAGSQAYG